MVICLKRNESWRLFDLQYDKTRSNKFSLTYFWHTDAAMQDLRRKSWCHICHRREIHMDLLFCVALARTLWKMRRHSRICNVARVHVLLVLQQLKKSPSSCVSCTCILMISFLSDDDRDCAWLVVYFWFISSLCQPTQTPTHNFA